MKSRAALSKIERAIANGWSPGRGPVGVFAKGRRARRRRLHPEASIERLLGPKRVEVRGAP